MRRQTPPEVAPKTSPESSIKKSPLESFKRFTLRKRTKSEKPFPPLPVRFDDAGEAYRGITGPHQAGAPRTPTRAPTGLQAAYSSPTIVSGAPLLGPEYPEFHDPQLSHLRGLIPAGIGNPHSPLRRRPGAVQTPPRYPIINHEDIGPGCKWPTASSTAQVSGNALHCTRDDTQTNLQSGIALESNALKRRSTSIPDLKSLGEQYEVSDTAPMGELDDARSSSSLSLALLGQDFESEDISGPASGREASLGYREGSSSSAANHEPIRRAGTPPLLFGKNAMSGIPKTQGEYKESSSSSILARTLESMGVGTSSQLGKASGSDNDWETLEGSGHHEQQRIWPLDIDPDSGSSLADYTESGPSVKPEPLWVSSNRPVLQHPAHPRYTHSWNLMNDRQSGRVALVPQHDQVGITGPISSNTHPALVQGRVADHAYHHPSPLTKEHTNPFRSSPPSVGRSSVSLSPAQQEEEQWWADHGSRETHLRKYAATEAHGTPNDLKRDFLTDFATGDTPEFPQIKIKSVKSGTGASVVRRGAAHSSSSAWLTTVDEVSSNSQGPTSNRQDSFSKFTTLGPKANLTGTPQGTGAREVGSSLAGTSSPAQNFDSSPPCIQTPSYVHTPPSLRGQLVEQLSRESNARSGIIQDPYYGTIIPARQPRSAYPYVPYRFQRPLARAESPHLHRVPPNKVKELERREKLVSITTFVFCSIVPPMLVYYGHGGLDGIMVHYTGGYVKEMRPCDKKAGLYLGYGVVALVFVVVAIVLSLALNRG